MRGQPGGQFIIGQGQRDLHIPAVSQHVIHQPAERLAPACRLAIGMGKQAKASAADLIHLAQIAARGALDGSAIL